MKRFKKLFSAIALAAGLFLLMGSSAQASSVEVEVAPELTFLEQTQLNRIELGLELFCISGAPVATFRVASLTNLLGGPPGGINHGWILATIPANGIVTDANIGLVNGFRRVNRSGTIGWVPNNRLIPATC